MNVMLRKMSFFATLVGSKNRSGSIVINYRDIFLINGDLGKLICVICVRFAKMYAAYHYFLDYIGVNVMTRTI